MYRVRIYKDVLTWSILADTVMIYLTVTSYVATYESTHNEYLQEVAFFIYSMPLILS